MTSSATSPKVNLLGPWQVVFMVVAAAAPLTGMLGAAPAAIMLGNGAGLPGAYLIAGVILLLFSVGFTTMSRHVSEAGAFYAYVRQGLGRSLGFGSALVALVSYTAVQIALYALFGFFCMTLISEVLPWYVYAVIALALVQLIGLRNIELNSRILGVLMCLEMGILVVLAVVIIFQGGGPEGLTLEPFHPTQVFSGHLGIAVMFAMASFLGFEATAIYADDCRDPSRTVPRATYIAVVLIGLFFAFITWSIVCAYGPTAVVAAATSDPANFWFAQSTARLGPATTTIMGILLISSIFASILAFHNAISRYALALAQEGWMPRILAEIHPRFLSPYRASYAQTLSALALVAALAISGADPYALVFSWMSAFATIGLVGLQVLVSLSVVVYFRRSGHGAGTWQTVVAPILGGLGLLIVLWLLIDNLPALSGSESPYLTLLPIGMLLVLLMGVAIERLRPVRAIAQGGAVLP